MSATASSATAGAEPPGDNVPNREDLSKTVLACLFGIVALALVVVVVTWRRKNRPLSSFFRVSHSPFAPARSLPRTSSLPTAARPRSFPHSSYAHSRPHSYPRTRPAPAFDAGASNDSVILAPSFLYPSLAHLPPSLLPPTRPPRPTTTRAADIDPRGRRVASGHPEDSGDQGDGGQQEKDELPPYERFGSPPKYDWGAAPGDASADEEELHRRLERQLRIEQGRARGHADSGIVEVPLRPPAPIVSSSPLFRGRQPSPLQRPAAARIEDACDVAVEAARAGGASVQTPPHGARRE